MIWWRLPKELIVKTHGPHPKTKWSRHPQVARLSCTHLDLNKTTYSTKEAEAIQTDGTKNLVKTKMPMVAKNSLCS